ncbi:hypothetical protein C5C36_15795 [Rathayibacter sp. AY1G1]|uniref:hypothetical protein n=1 Tax=unclassified Rathayibacter TaxID=2609250 RepID=UPI000CE8FED8|nr:MULTISPECIES: hypothetical protein [unclassified Rathayibacter]PPH08064.1 hypothetical protein C5C71_13500 [Rathayibacter sp. AY1C1]PPH08876.1 hypothetical protein C5C36_15795 [Rathayibacter sp. AY1G1]PPH16594.1 hypothetical protein C5C99_15900 [Rathayibacter sp. AY1C4]
MSSPAPTRPFVGVARIAVGAAAVAVILHTYALSIVAGESNPFDYFGYFTNQTSLLASAVLIVAGSVALARRPTPVWLSYVRGAATAYLIVVAVIYNTLVPGTGTAPPWVSAVLLVRGATDGWVPYGFLLPENGTLSLVLHVAGLTCAVLLAGALVWALSRRRASSS